MRQSNRSEVAICTSKDMARRLLDYIENSERDGNTRLPDLPPYVGQEVTCRTGHGTTDCFQIGKEVCQGCILSPCLFTCRVHHVKRWAG